jgi:Phosphodiester glycosidase
LAKDWNGLAVCFDAAVSYKLRRDRLGDGDETTVYAVGHPLAAVKPRICHFRQPRRLDWWCAKNGIDEAVVGGFYLRDPFRPLGDLWLEGRPVEGTPFPPEYRPLRPALHVTDGEIRIAPRGELPDAPDGDLLQAGPLLVRDGRVVFDRDEDREGFSAGCDQFDSDITLGRHPRAAVGVGDSTLWVLACDGRRSRVDAGLTLGELAEAMLALGCQTAMNLDGGGSTTLVHRRHLLNRPYSEQDQPAPASRPIVTALIL